MSWATSTRRVWLARARDRIRSKASVVGSPRRGERALGLLDHDPAVQGALQLLGESLGLDRLRSWRMAIVATSARAWTTPDLVRLEVGRPRPEEVERADDLVAQSHREGVHRLEPRLDRAGSEDRPPVGGVGEVGVDDGRAGGEAVQARALVVLDLEQLEELARTRCSTAMNLTRPRWSDSTRPTAAAPLTSAAFVGEVVEEVDEVVVVDEGVGHFDEELGQVGHGDHGWASYFIGLQLRLPHQRLVTGQHRPPRQNFFGQGGRGPGRSTRRAPASGPTPPAG